MTLPTRASRFPARLARRFGAATVAVLVGASACSAQQETAPTPGAEAPREQLTTGARPTIPTAPGSSVRGPFQAQDHAYRVVTVAEPLEHPWGMAFLPSGEILVTERPGRLRLIRDGSVVPEPIGGLPEVFARSQGGLLDVALHPDFETNRLVYISYSKPGQGGATTAVARGRFDGSRLTDVEDIFVGNAFTNTGQHFGSRLVFDGRGHLFFSIGDRGVMQQAQNPSNHQGTIIRIHDDGRIPSDNPFVGRSDALPEIWAYGVRNPQGLALHPQTGELWETEHGPRGGDEVNLILPGRNYGWPVITHGINYDGSIITERTAMEGMEQPLHHWTPSIATSGLTIYDGDAFPRWRGNLLTGGLAGQQIARVVFDGHRFASEETLFRDLGRVRDVRTGPDGFIYVLIDAGAGSLVRLEPA
jgi:aldose sugar dehydrogenase